MSIYFFTDPHIGVNRVSHTTPASRARLKDKVFSTVDHLVRHSGVFICLGDLFDKASNSELDISMGVSIAGRCAVVLGGNHDLPNREGTMSSLQLMQSFVESEIVCGRTGQVLVHATTIGGLLLLFVPHHASQALFEQALDEASKRASESEDMFRVLCLHCNYDNHFAEEADASLNLSRERAEGLVHTYFDYVLLGHEHNTRCDFEGRLVCLGNTFPIGFSDVGCSKFCWELTPERQLVKHELWSAEVGFRTYDWEVFLQEPAVPVELEFVDVTGVAPAARLPEIAVAITKLWKNHDHLLMVRNSVRTQEGETTSPAITRRAVPLPERISSALEDTELKALWNEYVGKVS